MKPIEEILSLQQPLKPKYVDPATTPLVLPKTQGHLAAEKQLKELREKLYEDIGMVPRRP